MGQKYNKALEIEAGELRPGMRARPKGPKGGWYWFNVTKVKRQGFLVRIDAKWANGGEYILYVKPKQKFRASFLSDFK